MRRGFANQNEGKAWSEKGMFDLGLVLGFLREETYLHQFLADFARRKRRARSGARGSD
jgi:hypothetical protein